MCFSAPVSLIAGGVLVTAGSLAVSGAKTKPKMSLAAMPLFFGVQQLIEGGVWLTLGNPVLNQVFMYGFLAFSHVLWPMYVPWAIYRLEKDKERRDQLKYFIGLGVLTGLYLLYFVSFLPVTCQAVGGSMVYNVQTAYIPLVTVAYLVATCGSMLTSSLGQIRQLGLIFLAAAGLSFLIFTQAFISVWCFFAAGISLWIYWYVTRSAGSKSS